VLIISFTSPNSVLLIHHKFERGIRYVLAFSIIVFLQWVLYIFSPPVHVYIQAIGYQMNTNAIHNSHQDPYLS
jgi:hydrogenase-4 membrane subunit HyfE